MSLTIKLTSPEETLRLGLLLAKSLAGQSGHIFLEGPLGAGKTTLVRGLAEALDKDGQAEVSSPSFNLVNLYPTSPPIAHVDLYRLDKSLGLDESIVELLEKTRYLVLLEWPDRLAEEIRPESYLLLRWLTGPDSDNSRLLEIIPKGAWAGELFARLEPELESDFDLL